MNFIKKYGLLILYVLFFIFSVERIVHIQNDSKRIIFVIALLYIVFRLLQIGMALYRRKEE